MTPVSLPLLDSTLRVQLCLLTDYCFTRFMSRHLIVLLTLYRHHIACHSHTKTIDFLHSSALTLVQWQMSNAPYGGEIFFESSWVSIFDLCRLMTLMTCPCEAPAASGNMAAFGVFECLSSLMAECVQKVRRPLALMFRQLSKFHFVRMCEK